jgi:hypothetical protein
VKSLDQNLKVADINAFLSRRCCENHNSSVTKRKSEIVDIEKAIFIAELKFELDQLKSLGEIVAFHDEMVHIALRMIQKKEVKHFDDEFFRRFTLERTILSYDDYKELRGFILDYQSQKLLRSDICLGTVCSKKSFIPSVLEFIDKYCSEYYFLRDSSSQNTKVQV